jgi:hypothetical protein
MATSTTIKRKPRKPAGYQARPWLKLIPRTKATNDNRARLLLPSGELLLDERITASPVTMSLDETATVTFSVADQPGTLEVLALADTDEGKLLSGIDVRWRGLWWRVTRIERDAGMWHVVCEDRVAAYMRSHKRLVTASRNDVTRAEFVHRLTKGVKAGGGVPVYIPELRERQGVYGETPRKATKTASRPEVDTTALGGAGGRAGSGSAGWGSAGGQVKVRRKQAKSFQLKTIDVVLSTAQELGASRRVLIACVMFITQQTNAGEPREKKPRDGADTSGTFRQGPDWISRAKAMDDAAATRAFLLGHEAKVGGSDPAKKGWKQRHGSLQAAKGELAEMIDEVHGGGRDTARWQREATATVDLWLDRNADGGSVIGPRAAAGPDDTDRRYRGQYEFRTKGDEPMNWWDATGALASEVRWHRWAVSNTFGFATDGEMIRGSVALRVTAGAPGLLGLSWTWDNRREASALAVRLVLSDPFQLLPGMVAMVDDEQPISGRWLVDSVQVDPCRGGFADVMLRRPVGKRREPAPG